MNNDILSRFSNVTSVGNDQYRADCPACGDRKQHLYIKEQDGKLLLDCKKGCKFVDIVAAAGLDTKDCFPPSDTSNKMQLDREHFYKDTDGRILAKKQILKKPNGEKMAVWYRCNNGSYSKGLNGLKMPLYHLDLLMSSQSDTVLVVEGEKDVETCEKLGYTATTSPNGASAKWNASYTACLKGKKVFILTDNDEAGRTYGLNAAEIIEKAAASVKVIHAAKIYPNVKDKGDISDIVAEVGAEKAKSMLETAMKKTSEYHISEQVKELPSYFYEKINEKTGEITYMISCPLLAEHFRANQHYFWLKSQGSGKPLRYIYNNGVYSLVSDDEIKSIIKQYITDFMPLSLKMRDVDEVFKNLCCDNVFHDVDELNADENIINFENGLLYLDTLELKEHTPEVLSTIQIHCNWNIHARSLPVFEKYLSTLTDGKADEQLFIMQIIGVIISNIKGFRFKMAIFMVGKGNTGKSQLKNLIERIIGKNNCAPCDIKDLEERFGTSALYGKRLIGASDMSFMTVKELKTFKSITGGDSITIEFKGRDSFPYVFGGIVWFCANQMPRFGGDRGEHVYSRIVILRCDNVIPEEQQDKYLCDKMYAEREALVVAAVMALKDVLDNGGQISIPESCKFEKEQYKIENSSVLSFYNECCCERIGDKISDSCTRAKMYDVYKAWCKDNGRYATPKNAFSQELADILANGDISKIVKTVHGQRYFTITLTLEIKKEYASIYGVDIVQ